MLDLSVSVGLYANRPELFFSIYTHWSISISYNTCVRHAYTCIMYIIYCISFRDLQEETKLLIPVERNSHAKITWFIIYREMNQEVSINWNLLSVINYECPFWSLNVEIVKLEYLKVIFCFWITNERLYIDLDADEGYTSIWSRKRKTNTFYNEK